MTATVLSTKIVEVDNKIPDHTGLVNKTDHNAEILEIEGKYMTTFDYNKCSSDIIDARIK